MQTLEFLGPYITEPPTQHAIINPTIVTDWQPNQINTKTLICKLTFIAI